MDGESGDGAEETGKDVEPVPCGPVPGADRLGVVAEGVVHVLELHTGDAADGHEEGAEEGDEEDAPEVLEAVGGAEPGERVFHG